MSLTLDIKRRLFQSLLFDIYTVYIISTWIIENIIHACCHHYRDCLQRLFFTFHSKDQEKYLLNHSSISIKQLRLSSSSFRFFFFYIQDSFHLVDIRILVARYRFRPVSLIHLRTHFQQSIFHNFLFLSILYFFFIIIIFIHF